MRVRWHNSKNLLEINRAEKNIDLSIFQIDVFENNMWYENILLHQFCLFLHKKPCVEIIVTVAPVRKYVQHSSPLLLTCILYGPMFIYYLHHGLHTCDTIYVYVASQSVTRVLQPSEIGASKGGSLITFEAFPSSYKHSRLESRMSRVIGLYTRKSLKNS